MTKTRVKAARSTQTPGAPNKNPSGLPYGAGSIQVRGNVWWMIYRDTEGRVIQENTRTEDQDVARRMLAARALETLRAKIAVLEAILNEDPAQKKGRAAARGGKAGADTGHAGSRKAVRGDAARRGDGKGTGGKR